jgi:hypothetical protein
MIARHDDGVYEVKMRRERNHAILMTTVTSFTTRGHFNIWMRDMGSRQIDTVNGFTQTWNVYQEDTLGGLIHHVRRARAGDETSENARAAMVLLIRAGLSSE